MDLVRLAVLAGVAVANIAVALMVFLRNKKAAANRAFAQSVFAIVLWLSLDYFGDQRLFAADAALLKRLTLAAGMLMGALLLNFALVFPTRERETSWGWWLYFGVGGALIAITSFTRAVQASASVTPMGTTVTFGPLMPIFAAWALLGVALTVAVLVGKYGRAEGRPKAQLRYMAAGAALFAVSSLTAGLVVPLATGSSWLPRLVPASTLLLVGFTAYAIAKHRMMDVRLVVLRSVVYTVLVSLAGALMVLPAVLLRASTALHQSVDANSIFFVVGLAAVFAFQPVRLALERATDRLLFRQTYDPDELLHGIGTAMSSTLDIDALGVLLARRLATSMRLTFAAVAYFHADCPVATGSGVSLSESDTRRLLAVCKGTSILVADDLQADGDAARMLGEFQVRVLVPLAMDGLVVGAIVLGPKESGEIYSAQDLKFLEILAPEASMAVRNAHLFDEKNERVRELTALNQLAYALGANIELESVLDAAMGQLAAVTQADSGSIMLLDNDDMILRIAASCGIREDVVATTQLALGEGVAGWVAKTREPLILVDDTDPRFRRDLRRSEIVSAISAPIICKDEVIGVLNVNRGQSGDLFTRENLNVVRSFAGQMAVVIENARLYRDLENTILGTISALAAAVDAKDPYTFGHSRDVTEYCIGIAEKLGMPDAETQRLHIAATLHDIGKIGIDGAILNKPGRLTDEETWAMRRHPTIGADILASLDFLRDAVPLILFHHERFGGGGYPSGVSGEAIPLGARIISVADSFNAMTSDRPYRKALSLEVARCELLENAGTQFDPDVVSAFLEVLDERAACAGPSAVPTGLVRRSARQTRPGSMPPEAGRGAMAPVKR